MNLCLCKVIQLNFPYSLSEPSSIGILIFRFLVELKWEVLLDHFSNEKRRNERALPISSIRGAILKVIPTKNRHITNNNTAVNMIVHLARSGKSSDSMTCWEKKFLNQSVRNNGNKCFTSIPMTSSNVLPRLLRLSCLLYLKELEKLLNCLEK